MKKGNLSAERGDSGAYPMTDASPYTTPLNGTADTRTDRLGQDQDSPSQGSSDKQNERGGEMSLTRELWSHENEVLPRRLVKDAQIRSYYRRRGIERIKISQRDGIVWKVGTNGELIFLRGLWQARLDVDMDRG